MTPGGHYTFTVSAVNSINEGAQSGSVEIIAASRPDAPAQPTKKSASAAHIEPEWTRPFTGGSDIRGYKVYKDGVHDPSLFVTDWDVLFLLIADDIVPGTNYDVAVSAYNDVGEGDQSQVRTIMAAAVPDIPTGVAKVS